MQSLYPELEPFHHFYLATGSEHSIYVEQAGNPQGVPVLFLHGGPCSGTKPHHRCFFDPEKYHIILVDQRGCGKSRPFGELKNNTTQHLLADMERIRERLAIEKWLLFGGSWGSTLILLYAEQYRERVSGMILRGVFLARPKDHAWFIKEGGVNRVYPEAWQQLIDSAPQAAESDCVAALYDAVFSQHPIVQQRVARAWINWGGQVALMGDFQALDANASITTKMLQQVQMELHYAKHDYFVSSHQVLDACSVLQDIPAVIIHGCNDLVCPMEAGFSLSKALPNAEFKQLKRSGHIASSDEMIDALVSATDAMLALIQ